MSQWEMFESQVKAIPSPMSSYQGPSVSIIHPSDLSILLPHQTYHILILISLVSHLSISESAKVLVLRKTQLYSRLTCHTLNSTFLSTEKYFYGRASYNVINSMNILSWIKSIYQYQWLVTIEK